jgi:hypothetical protein
LAPSAAPISTARVAAAAYPPQHREEVVVVPADEYGSLFDIAWDHPDFRLFCEAAQRQPLPADIEAQFHAVWHQVTRTGGTLDDVVDVICERFAGDSRVRRVRAEQLAIATWHTLTSRALAHGAAVDPTTGALHLLAGLRPPQLPLPPGDGPCTVSREAAIARLVGHYLQTLD